MEAKILIVDDNKKVLTLFQTFLENVGYTVYVATNGNEALRVINQHPIDLIITDIVMPDKEGLELITELRRNYPDMKIIAISGGGQFSAMNYLWMAKHLGADETVSKPIEMERMLATIRNVLQAE